MNTQLYSGSKKGDTGSKLVSLNFYRNIINWTEARPVQKTRHLVRKWQEVCSLRATVGRYSIAYRP